MLKWVRWREKLFSHGAHTPTGGTQWHRPGTVLPPAALEFDVQFAGAATVEQLKATEQKTSSKFIKNATKQAQREAKIAKKEANRCDGDTGVTRPPGLCQRHLAWLCCICTV